MSLQNHWNVKLLLRKYEFQHNSTRFWPQKQWLKPNFRFEIFQIPVKLQCLKSPFTLWVNSDQKSKGCESSGFSLVYNMVKIHLWIALLPIMFPCRVSEGGTYRNLTLGSVVVKLVAIVVVAHSS